MTHHECQQAFCKFLKLLTYHVFQNPCYLKLRLQIFGSKFGWKSQRLSLHFLFVYRCDHNLCSQGKFDGTFEGAKLFYPNYSAASLSISKEYQILGLLLVAFYFWCFFLQKFRQSSQYKPVTSIEDQRTLDIQKYHINRQGRSYRYAHIFLTVVHHGNDSISCGIQGNLRYQTVFDIYCIHDFSSQFFYVRKI